MLKKENILPNLVIVLTVLYKFLLTFKIEETVVLAVLPVLFVICILDMLLKEKINKKVAIRLAAIAVPILVLSYVIKSANFFLPILIGITSIDRDYKAIARTFSLSILILSLITIVAYKIGYLDDVQMLRGSIVRHSMGFLHPNALGGNIACGLIIFLYSCNNNKNAVIVTLIITFLIYSISLSRTGLVLVATYLIAVLITKTPLSGILRYCYLLLPVLFVITIVITQMSYDSINVLNKVFSGRLEANKEIIESGVISMFTPSMKILEKVTVDNYYISLLLRFGIIGFLVFFIYNYRTTKKLSESIELCPLIMSFLIITVSESTAMISSLNIIMSLQVITFLKGGEYAQVHS